MCGSARLHNHSPVLQGGVETTAWIRREEARRVGGSALPPTPVVGLTGSVHPDDVAICLAGEVPEF